MFFSKLIVLLMITAVMGEENCFQKKNNQSTHLVSLKLVQLRFDIRKKLNYFLKINFCGYKFLPSYFVQVETPTVNDILFDNVCACLKHHPGTHTADFMTCPGATPYIRSVSFIKCDDRTIPTGVDCMGARVSK